MCRVQCGGADGCTFANFVQKLLKSHLLRSKLHAIIFEGLHLGVGKRAIEENINRAIEAVNANSTTHHSSLVPGKFLRRSTTRRSRNVNIRREEDESFGGCKKKD